jgi:hypothetical protein
MVNPFVTKSSRQTEGAIRLDQRVGVTPASLTGAQLDAVAAGLNPQPLPPYHEEFELR